MTSDTPHPDLDRLADLAEDLLGPTESAALRAHLADCPACADTVAALVEVRELLGAAEPPALPEDVARRIDAALAAEAATTTTPPVVPAAAPARPLPAPPGKPTAATGPGRPGARRRRPARVLLGVAGLLAVLGLGSLVLRPGDDGHPSAAANQPAVTATTDQHPALAGGTEYRDDQLTAQIRQLLGTTRPGPRAQTAGPEPLTAQLPGCVTALTGRGGETPAAIDHGQYHGAPVDVLVYRQAQQLDVYLVTPDCPGATVLLHRTISP